MIKRWQSCKKIPIRLVKTDLDELLKHFKQTAKNIVFLCPYCDQSLVFFEDEDCYDIACHQCRWALNFEMGCYRDADGNYVNHGNLSTIKLNKTRQSVHSQWFANRSIKNLDDVFNCMQVEELAAKARKKINTINKYVVTVA